MESVKFIDLFAGLGGIRLGFESAIADLGLRSECVFASEIKPSAIKAYRGHFGENEGIFGDITCADTARDIPDFDFLLAGFPCQPFSFAGSRQGFADTRGTLFFEIERILKEKIKSGCPAKGFLLENVEGLLTHDKGNTIKVIIDRLQKLGYKVNHKLIDSQFFGLPQSRKRVYIVGTLTEEISLDNFDNHTSCLGDILQKGKPVTDSAFTRKLLNHYRVEDIVGKSIKDKRGGKNNIHSWDIDLKGETTDEEKRLLNMLLTERRKKHWACAIGIKWMDGMPLTEDQIKTFYDVPNLHNILKHLTDLGYLKYEHPKQLKKTRNGTFTRIADKNLEKGYNIVAGKLSFEFSKILDPKQLAPTLVATDVSRLGVVDGLGIRRLTVREGLRLCGYPDNYKLDMVSEKQAFDLLGNTVCVPVIKEISLRLGNHFVGRKDDSQSSAQIDEIRAVAV